MRRNETMRRWLASAGLVITLAGVAAYVALNIATIRAGGAVLDALALNQLVLGVMYGIVGWIVASRRSENPIGWVFLVIALSQTVESFAGIASSYGLVLVPGSIPLADIWSWVSVWAWAPGFTLFVTFSLLLFPDGHLPSRRWRPVAWLSVLMLFLQMVPIAVLAWPLRGIALMNAAEPDIPLGIIGALMIPVLALASVGSIVIRFRHSTGPERQQLRWFTYAAIPEIAYAVAAGFNTLPPAILLLGAIFIIPLLPIAIGMAVLRYRLYDLDRIVSRTIAYAVVTGALAATFGASILLLQAVLAPFTQGETVAVAASTLAVAALFQPVMRRVRRAVDRRFDRARYDAERTAAAFAERLRSKFDMTTVATDLTGTIETALAPATIGIWLRGRETSR